MVDDRTCITSTAEGFPTSANGMAMAGSTITCHLSSFLKLSNGGRP